MTARGLAAIALFLALTVALAVPLGRYIARVMSDESEGQRTWLDRVLGPLERGIYRLLGVTRASESAWKPYATGMLLFTVAGIFLTYAILRAPALLPLNPQGLPAPSPDLAWNTAISFVTNTNWQNYGGESTMSYGSQMLALAVQNFVCAASGLAVVVALIRGIVRRTTSSIGSFWVDLTRGTLYVLLPLSLVVALLLVSQGVV